MIQDVQVNGRTFPKGASLFENTKCKICKPNEINRAMSLAEERRLHCLYRRSWAIN